MALVCSALLTGVLLLNFAPYAGTTPTLVAYTMKSCVFCQKMAGEWSKLERLGKPALINVMKIDCNDNPVACSSAGVKVFPTIILYKGRKIYRYTGDKDAKTMLKWASGV